MTETKITDSFLLDLLGKVKELAESNFAVYSTKDKSDVLTLFKELKRPDINIHIGAKLTPLGKDVEILAEEVRKHIGAIRVTNCSMYTPDYLMDWHTNSNMKGKRVYIVYNYGDTVFRYIDGEQRDIVEPSNIWLMKEFEIPSEGLLWHTVATNDYRITLGFML